MIRCGAVSGQRGPCPCDADVARRDVKGPYAGKLVFLCEWHDASPPPTLTCVEIEDLEACALDLEWIVVLIDLERSYCAEMKRRNLLTVAELQAINKRLYALYTAQEERTNAKVRKHRDK